jgi:hypothetical protein
MAIASRKQRQVHARLALRDAVAHGRRAAGKLRDAAGGTHRFLDDCWKAFERLVRRQHVVISRHDGH